MGLEGKVGKEWDRKGRLGKSGIGKEGRRRVGQEGKEEVIINSNLKLG